MTHPPIRSLSRSSVLLLLLATGCGGGGGGGASARPAASVAGRLSVTPGSTNGGTVLEQEPNDPPFQENRVGDTAPGVAYTVAGEIANVQNGATLEQDLDLFRFTVASAGLVHVKLTPDVGGRPQIACLLLDENLGINPSLPNPFQESDLPPLATGTVYYLLVAPFTNTGAGNFAYRMTVATTANALARLSSGAGLPPISTEVQRKLTGAHLPMVPGEVVALVDPVAVTAAAAPELDGLSLRTLDRASGFAVYQVPAALALTSSAAGAAPEQSAEALTVRAALRLRNVPGIRAASPNFVYHKFDTEPNDRFYPAQWHYRQIKLPQAWSITTGSDQVTVAVIDTGVVMAHPDLVGRLLGDGFDFISSTAASQDGDGIDANPDDPGDGRGTGQPSSFHGTHVAGTIGAATNNGLGVAGVDWACKILPIRVLGKGGSGTLADIAQGILYAAGLPNASGRSHKVDVINMSLGGPGGGSVLEDACNRARAAGVLVVAAAGNDGSSTPNFPASYPSVVSVGAVRFDKQLAPYSNFASTMDLVAPGGDVTVDQNGDNNPDGVLSTRAEDGTPPTATVDFLNGTSMASPHVAGVAALIKAAGRLAVPPRELSANEIEQILLTTTEDLGPAGKDARFANGLVDALAALRQASGQSATGPARIVSNPGSADFGNTATTMGLNLTNPGAGLVTVGAPVVAFQGAAAGWLTAAVGGTATTAIDKPALSLAVVRAGLPDGDYSAFVTVGGTANGTPVEAVRIQVLMRVGGEPSVNDTIFVLLIKTDTFDTVAQADAKPGNGFAWQMPGVTPGTYFLVAGTDRDNDDVIGEDEDLFGVWPTSDQPQPLTLAAGQGLSNLDFPVGPVNSGFSAGRPRMHYRRLR